MSIAEAIAERTEVDMQPLHVDADRQRQSSGWIGLLAAQIGDIRSSLDTIGRHSDAPSFEETVMAEAIDQMTRSPLRLIGKGINTSRFNDIAPGLRTKIGREFGDSQGLATFVLAAALCPARSELTTRTLAGVGHALTDPTARHEDVIVQLGRAYFSALCDDPCLELQTFAWLAAHESVYLRRAFESLYASLGERVSECLVVFLDSWGRTPIAGISVEDIATSLTSLMEGLAMRAAVDPDAVDQSLPSAMILALLQGTTQPILVTEG